MCKIKLGTTFYFSKRIHNNFATTIFPFQIGNQTIRRNKWKNCIVQFQPVFLRIDGFTRLETSSKYKSIAFLIVLGSFLPFLAFNFRS